MLPLIFLSAAIGLDCWVKRAADATPTIAQQAAIASGHFVSAEVWVVSCARSSVGPSSTRKAGTCPSHGRFWLDPNDGRVLQSEAHYRVPDFAAAEHRRDDRRGLSDRAATWVAVPALMRERYEFGVSHAVTGTATYGHFRAVGVGGDEPAVAPDGRNSLLVLVGLLVFAASAPRTFAGQSNTTNPTDPRYERVEQWLKAVLHHQPGEVDDAGRLVASWSDADVRTLRLDVNVVVQIMRAPGRRRTGVPGFRSLASPSRRSRATWGINFGGWREAPHARAGGACRWESRGARGLAGLCFEFPRQDGPARCRTSRRSGTSPSMPPRRRGRPRQLHSPAHGALLHGDIAMLVLRSSGPLTGNGAGDDG